MHIGGPVSTVQQQHQQEQAKRDGAKIDLVN